MQKSRTNTKPVFKTGAKPTQEDFWDLFDSVFFRADDSLPIDKIEGLSGELEKYVTKKEFFIPKGIHLSVASTAVRDLIPETIRAWGMEVKVGDTKYELRRRKENAALSDNENWLQMNSLTDFYIPVQYIATNVDAEILAEFGFTAKSVSKKDNVSAVRVYLNGTAKSFPFAVAKGDIIRLSVTTTQPDGIALVNLNGTKA
ncbi:MAG: hypothetical protein MI784_09280 [Cytophagales bacterium]|nr:hypothetical protein [Cytophagales bacterium]